MLESPAALHRSRLYRLVARLVIVSLLLQALLPVPGPGTPVAQAGNGDPPLPVVVLDDPPPPATPEPPYEPPGVTLLPPGARVVPVAGPPDPPPSTPPAAPPPPVPVSFTLSTTPSAAPGDLLTLTLTITNPEATTLRNLELRAFVPEVARFAGGPPWQADPPRRLISTTIPLVGHRATVSRQFRLRLIGVPAGNRLQPEVTLALAGVGESTARATVAVDNPVTVGTFGIGGGELRSGDGRLRLAFPPGSLAAATRVEQRWRYAGELWPERPYRLLLLQLDAFDVATGAAVHTFGTPLSLTLRVDDLLAGAPAQRVYVRAWNAETPAWEVVAGPVTPDAVNGTIQVALTHFSEFEVLGEDSMEAGERHGWRLLFNDATAGLFNGSVSYSYPIDVPPGRHGLQPQLALTYNSDRVNGVLETVQSDWAGLGWSLDAVEITRKMGYGADGLGEGVWDGYALRCSHEGDLCLSNEYTLLFQGTSHRLIPEPNTNRYHTADESFLTITRECTGAREGPCSEMTNEPGHHPGQGTELWYDYWVVTTQDGTRYRLGSQWYSQQRASNVCIYYSPPDPLHRCGTEQFEDLVGPAVYRWRLDQATDVYGNQLRYEYVETQANQQGYGLEGELYGWDRESYLSRILYTPRDDPAVPWGYAVEFVLRCRTGAPNCAPGDYEPDAISDAPAQDYGGNREVLWFERKVLSAIRVLQMTSASEGAVIREYLLRYYSTAGNELPSRVLASVTPYGLGGCMPDEAWQCTTANPQRLPPLELSYEVHNNQGNQEPGLGCETREEFPYGRLDYIHNGYGGVIALDYEAPEFDPQWGHNCFSYLYNWRVKQKSVTDNVSTALVTTYTYSWPCYAGAMSTCEGLHEDGQRLVGYGQVQVNQYSGSPTGMLLRRSEHRFFPDSADWDGSHHDFGQRLYALVGREKLVRQLGASGVTLAEVETVYGSTPILERHDPNLKDVLFVHADEVIQRQYDTGGALQVQTRSATTYRTDIGKPSEQYTYGQTRLLANGGFEGASTEEFGLHVPEGWSSFHNLGVGTMGLAPVMTPAARVVGMAALAITHTAEGPCQCGVLQTLTAEQGIVAGTPYVVRARVRTASGAPTFRIWLSDGPNHSPRNEVVPSLDWQLFTQTFTPQATAALTVHLSLESGVGSVYVDDVWYERLDETGDEQTQKTWYTSPVTTGVEGLPMAVRVYTGTEVLADGQEAALTTYYYDNASGLGEVTLGALTAESRNHIIAQNWSLPQYRYTTRFGYDAYGNQTVVTDTRGYTSTTSFDPIYHSYPMTFTNALAQQSFLRYDFGLGKVITAVKAYDAMGRGGVETWLKYDAFGRLTHVVDDANNPSVAERDTLELPTLQYVYSDTYQTGLIRGPRIETIWREQSGTEQVKRQFEFYTGRGLLMQTRSEWGQDASPVQAVVNVTYDALGRATTSYTPVSEWYNTDYTQPITTVAKTQTQYDLLGRTVVVTGTDGLTTTTAYHGLQTAVVDANRHQKVSVVDTRGQLVTVKEYQAEYPQADFDAQPYATTHYEYNVLGNLTRVTDDQANVTTMSYNAIGQKLGMDDPDMADWEYRYDAAGNLISQRDAKLHYTCFYYDPLSRLKGKVFNGGSTCSETDPGYGGYSEAYYYDQPGHGYGLGQRTTMSNTNAIVAWTYDRRGRVTAETRSVTGLGVYTTRMGYDTANRVVTTTYPTGETLTNTYTAAWQPAQLLSSWLPLPYNLYGEASFNVRGQMTTYNHYNNLHTDYTYNETGATPSFRLAELKLQQFDTGAQYLTFQYQYDHVGNLTRLTEATNAGQRQCFVYDALDRLTSAFTGSDDCTAYSSRGSAPYNHSGDNDYRYDELGSITQLAGRVYDYEGSGHAHAVRYAYNAGADGRFDAFTTAPADAWSISACPACSLSYDDGGERVARHGGLSSATTAYRALTPTLQVGDALQVEFKVDQGQAQADASLQLADEYGNNVFGLTATPNQALRVQYKLGGGAAVYAPLSPALAVQAHAWYVLRLEPGNGTRPARLSVWPRANPALRAYYEMTSSVWNSVTGWRFRSFANTQASNQTILSLDSYFELQGAGASVWSYLYDANGNMTSRIEAGTAYSQTWDAQNRLVQVVYGPITQTLANATYTFGYDADGGRVLQVAPGGYRTAYSGAYEETITPTAVYAQSFNGSGGSWTTSGGTWAWDKPAGLRKQTSTAPGESASVVNPAVTWGEITATARVRLDAGTNALAGLVVRRHTSNAPAYFVGIRNSDSAWYCGIYEKSGSTWTNRTPGLTNCKYATGGWHTLLVRAAGGRIEMHVDGVLITTWADATPLPAQGFGLMTLDGAASFDDIKVYGLATRSYYLFGAARVGERTTTHGQAAGSSTGAGGGTRYALHSDHLGSVSLATDAGGMTVTLSLARYFPFGAERGAAATGSPTDFGYATGRGSALGLTQLGARWLATKLARWSSADTLVPSAANPQSLNRYSYVNSSPLAYIDPTGHCRYVAGAFVYDENCSVEEFASLKWADRLAWLDQFVRLNGLDDWFADIRGAITLLSTDVDFKSLASWGAQTDAGVLQAIQDGWRIFKGRDPIGRLADDGIVGPAHIHGGAIWAKFFRSNEQYKRNLHAGAASPADLDALIDVRLKAEQAGVDYAVRITRPLHDGADAHTQIKIELFVRSANFYRQTLAPGLRSAGSSHPVTDPRTSWDTLSALSVAIDPMAWFLWGQAQSAEQPGRRLP